MGVLMTCCAWAQETLNVKVEVDDATDRKVLLVPQGSNDPASVTELTANGNRYAATVTATAPSGFYNLISIKGSSQTILPLYLPDGEANLKLSTANGTSLAEGSEDNRALAAYLTAYVAASRHLWDPQTDLTQKHLVQNFVTLADSVSHAYRCSPAVKSYLSIWGYLNAYDNYATVQRLLKRKAEEMPYERKEVLPEAHTVLDSPTAALFPNTPNVVFGSLPNQNNLDSALIYLDTHYTDNSLKEKVKDNIAARYVSRFNYDNGFEQGLQRLQLATEKYGLDPRHQEEFAKHRATIKGQPFPANVVLRDTLGNVVDFSTFRGKYVYIDLWASWCGPCCREVPHLQQLEKELQNDRVVFVSISIDSKEQAWKQKMKQLGMHGHQLHNPENTLCQALNIKGIPFFLIYDPEGNLYMHGAPRPSQGPGVKELLEGLK